MGKLDQYQSFFREKDLYNLSTAVAVIFIVEYLLELLRRDPHSLRLRMLSCFLELFNSASIRA